MVARIFWTGVTDKYVWSEINLIGQLPSIDTGGNNQSKMIMQLVFIEKTPQMCLFSLKGSQVQMICGQDGP